MKTPKIAALIAHAAQAGDIAALLLAARVESGLSLSELAERLDVGRQAVWGWENGDRHPRPELLARIAATLAAASQERAAPIVRPPDRR